MLVVSLMKFLPAVALQKEYGRVPGTPAFQLRSLTGLREGSGRSLRFHLRLRPEEELDMFTLKESVSYRWWFVLVQLMLTIPRFIEYKTIHRQDIGYEFIAIRSSLLL